MSAETHCYLGILPGERTSFIAVDSPRVSGSPESLADINATLRAGGRVERVTIEEGKAFVASHPWGSE